MGPISRCPRCDRLIDIDPKQHVCSEASYRDRCHGLLDRAFEATRQGDSFLGHFVNLVLKEPVGAKETV